MSSPPIAPATAGTSTRPYLIRALHDWCTDNGFTPYVAVYVDAQVRVPMAMGLCYLAHLYGTEFNSYCRRQASQ